MKKRCSEWLVIAEKGKDLFSFRYIRVVNGQYES